MEKIDPALLRAIYQMISTVQNIAIKNRVAIVRAIDILSEQDPSILYEMSFLEEKIDMVEMLHPYVDKYKIEELVPPINCREYLHICRAICCTFDFRLSEQDLDEGFVKWDFKKPYIIRSGPWSIGVHKYCYHNGARSHECHCNVYDHRPASCRWFDCRNDKRIWKDFEKKIPGYLLKAATDEQEG